MNWNRKREVVESLDMARALISSALRLPISALMFLPPPVVPSDEEPMAAGGRQVFTGKQRQILPPPVCRRKRNRWPRADGEFAKLQTPHAELQNGFSLEPSEVRG